MSIFFSLIKADIIKKLVDNIEEELATLIPEKEIKVFYKDHEFCIFDESEEIRALLQENNLVLGSLARKHFYRILFDSVHEIPLVSIEIEKHVRKSFCYFVKILPSFGKDQYKYGILTYKNLSQLDQESLKESQITKASPYFIKGGYVYLTRLSDNFTNSILHINIPEFFEKDIELIKFIRMPSVNLKIIVKSNKDFLNPTFKLLGKGGHRIRALKSEFSDERMQIIDLNGADFLNELFKPFIITKTEIKEEYMKLFFERGSLNFGGSLTFASKKINYEENAYKIFFEKLKNTCEDIFKKKVYVSEEVYNLQRNR